VSGPPTGFAGSTPPATRQVPSEMLAMPSRSWKDAPARLRRGVRPFRRRISAR